jgi:4-hydroxy-tetrahydrodipicolinate reductase
MTTKVCLAGATGWAGQALAAGIHRAKDLALVGAVSRRNAGETLDSVLGIEGLSTPISGSAAEALQSFCDVFVEYTKPTVARENIKAALEAGAHVVVGTSGLSAEDYQDIDRTAKAVGKGVLAAGNFALTAVLLQKFAEMAARYVPSWEIIDYAHADKADAPSGTVGELAHRLGQVRESKLAVPLKDTRGEVESRGARLDGTQVHSLRLPGFVISAEVLFGMPDQRLSIRHDAGSSAEPYVEGALLAIRKVHTLTGVHRGLDQVMEFNE